MMTAVQYYLLKLTEECAEISQIASKQMQFGGDGKHPRLGGETNRNRLREEINDLLAVIDRLIDLGQIPEITLSALEEAMQLKKKKMEKYLRQSQDLGFAKKEFESEPWKNQADGFGHEEYLSRLPDQSYRD